MKIKIINTLTLSNQGLSFYFDDGSKLQPVFLRQGDLDGACGPYAVSMLAIILGIKKRSDIEKLWDFYSTPIDWRTRFGKWISANINSIFEGTGNEQIQALFNAIQDKSVAYKTTIYSSSDELKGKVATGRKFFQIVRQQCEKELPSIIGLDWEGGGAHWVVAVGYQSWENGQKGDENFESILVLDPGASFDSTSAWNGVISKLHGKDGSKPYSYWSSSGNNTYCSITGGMLIDKITK
jgi:hypothetical protein